jgi:hypothetical protein
VGSNLSRVYDLLLRDHTHNSILYYLKGQETGVWSKRGEKEKEQLKGPVLSFSIASPGGPPGCSEEPSIHVRIDFVFVM